MEQYKSYFSKKIQKLARRSPVDLLGAKVGKRFCPE